MGKHGEKSVQVAQCLTTLGRIYQEQSEFKMALQSYNKALEVFEDLLNKPVLPQFRVLACAARTLNPTGRSRVTLSLR